ncbi:MAG: TonB-dependent receptor, partial [Phenylobacterium sp.]
IYPVPQWKAQVFAEYTNGPHNLRGTLNYADSYVDQRTTPFPPNVVRDGTTPSPGTAVPLPNKGQKIDSYTTIDLAYRVLLPWDTTAVLTVTNILDQDPSFARLDLGYDPFTGDPLGRTFKLNVTKKF